MASDEQFIERLLYQSRWFLAPLYIGLAFCLVLMLVRFCRQLFEFVLKIPFANESDVILGVLIQTRRKN